MIFAQAVEPVVILTRIGLVWRKLSGQLQHERNHSLTVCKALDILSFFQASLPGLPPMQQAFQQDHWRWGRVRSSVWGWIHGFMDSWIPRTADTCQHCNEPGDSTGLWKARPQAKLACGSLSDRPLSLTLGVIHAALGSRATPLPFWWEPCSFHRWLHCWDVSK